MKILHITPDRGWAPGLEDVVEDVPAGRATFLPDFCRFPVVMGTILASQLLGITLALASSWQGSSFADRLALISVHVLTIALLGSATLCAVRPLLRRCGDRTAAVLAWLLLVAIAALVTWGAFHLAPLPLRADLFPEGRPDDLMIRSLGISAILGAMVLRYLYLHHMWRLQVEAEAEARFQKLQARIRPHFLFNSMNTIANLTQTDPRLAEEVVQDLADLFRATLSEAHETSTLAKELELAYRYLNIEKQRLGERLQVLWDVEELPGDAPLPPLILQPLVENAVYHGIAPSRRPGLIQISGRYRQGRVNLSVRNSLPAETEQANRHTRGNRMALDNVKQRMAALFQGEAQVIIARVEGDYQVRLIFPYPWRRQ
jgi:two-component system, LytTR family, sensor histidine kinase AlgZ